jgi:hypothetical protein
LGEAPRRSLIVIPEESRAARSDALSAPIADSAAPAADKVVFRPLFRIPQASYGNSMSQFGRKIDETPMRGLVCLLLRRAGQYLSTAGLKSDVSILELESLGN